MQGVTYRVQLIVPSEKVEYVPREAAVETAVLADRILELRYYEDSVLGVGEYRRENLPIGARITGPAIIREDLSTTLICPRQVAQIGRCGEIVIEPVNT